MNRELLLQHFDRISEAPDAIPRLRRFILDLAVRGKLVEQDQNDEPASELLKRIQAEKARLVKEGKYRGSTVVKALPRNSALFAIPDYWVCASFGEIMISRDGERIPVSKEERNTRAKTYDYYGASGVIDKIDSYLFEKPLLLIGEDGANLINRSTPIAFIARGKYWVNNHAHVLDGISDDFLRFIELHINAIDLKPYVTGTAQPKMNQAKMNSIPIALPPLAEQYRIVAKVDELMALCDQLEAERNQRESHRDKLVAASLHRISTSIADEAKEAARFHLNLLPRLTTKPEHINQLRQTILNLAVRGRLVEQDPSDEPINETLKRVLDQRAALVRTKKIRQKKLDGFATLVKHEGLPDSWVVERLGNLVDPENTISYGVLVPGSETPDGVPFVRVQDLVLNSHPDRPNKSIDPEIEKAYARTRLTGGEILLCVVGSIGKLGVAPPSWAGANIARAIARIKPVPEICREYLLIVLRGKPVQTYFTDTTRTLAQPTLNVGLIELTPIPLPPLAEQRRIVTKVDQLMALCDQLEAQLATTESDSRLLLEAVLRDALQPSVMAA